MGIAFANINSMKKIFLALFIIPALSQCQQNSSKNSTSTGNNESKSEKPEIEKKISKRDYSITPANAYNDIFLDSLAMESFISENKLNDSITRRMRSFYNARNYQYAWFSGNGLTEQARTFWSLQSYYTTATKNTDADNKALAALMDRLELAENLSVTPQNKEIQKAEFLLTENFIQYILNNYEDGVVKRKELERFIPLRKTDPLKMADSLLTKKHKDNKYYADGNSAYKALKEQLQKYYTIAQAGGWPQVSPAVVKLKAGSSSPDVVALKKRLQATGQMPADTTPVFTPALDAGIKAYQTSLGLSPDGKISAELVKAMNVSVNQRIEQILINMDRMRWMPEAEGNLLMVNIPAFTLKVFEGNKVAHEMKVVVGKEGHNSMMFKGDLNQIVFSPYWNITPDIVKNEILPAMNRNPNYLASHNMEVTGNSGGLPVVRQLPGPENSLGKVKFLFPNSFNIYFHDTPAKSLFNKDKRAFSHGCIRLSEPAWLAEYLLRNMPAWNPQRINDAMNSGKENYVKLDKPVPVIITYYTAWVDEAGILNFRDDIYAHDTQLADKMFIKAN